MCAVADLRRVAGLGPGEGAAPHVLNLVAYTQAGSFARFIFLVASGPEQLGDHPVVKSADWSCSYQAIRFRSRIRVGREAV